ncbi:MAG: CpsD/CapB family tyrosine-protein kinase, partial [Rickettsiales bacterium]|nr:CpsD/CapB family tyrosine-protein kinase [Rickettsiales bacterium]
DKGLTQLLMGENTFDEVVAKDELSGLHYIRAISDTPHSNQLLGSQKMSDVLAEARSRYDVVILDSPPVMALSDTLMLAPKADAIIFLARWGETSRELVKSALKRLATAGTKLAGIVLNRVDIEQYERYEYGESGDYHSEYKAYYNN